MTEVGKENFGKEVTEAEGFVVADFWAPWCGYCVRLAPVFERLSKEYGDRVKFVKIDVDKNEALEDQFGVNTIPTLILFEKGSEVARAVNPGSQAQIVKFFETNGAI